MGNIILHANRMVAFLLKLIYAEASQADRVWVTSAARGSVSLGFWGSRQLSPFLGGGI